MLTVADASQKFSVPPCAQNCPSGSYRSAQRRPLSLMSMSTGTGRSMPMHRGQRKSSF